MKTLLHIILLMLFPLTVTFGQARITMTNGYIVERGGTAAKPLSVVLGNSNTNAIAVGNGWFISEDEFNILQWNIGTAAGTYVVPFGYSSAKYLPLTFDISTGGIGNGVVKFSTYHTIADQRLGVISLTGIPSDVNNMNALVLPGAPNDTDNSYHVADRFYIIDANTGYTTKPAANNITFSYISGTPNTEVGGLNTITESNLMAQRFNSTVHDTTWFDWFGEGCTDAVVNNVGTVQTGPVPVTDLYRSWSLWDHTMPLPLSFSTVNDNCNGGANGSATVTVNGGVSPYTYSWAPTAGTTNTITGLSAGTYTVSATDSHGCSSSATVTITQTPTSVAITIASQVNVPCNGGTGSATANAATGGKTPYTYNWTPAGGTNLTASNLSAGTYTITATDNFGCTGTTSVTITQPTILTAAANVSTNVSCNGGSDGSASSTIGGGTIPYSYSWTNGGTNSSTTGLTAGTYTLTVTDNNACTSTATVTITQPIAAVGITIASQTDEPCNGGTTGSATANAATGGTSPYSYSWTPSGGTNLTASNLSAGTYTITTTDNNGCTASAAATITQPAILTAIANITSNVNCNGGNNGSASSTIGGGTSPYTYSWTGGGTNSTLTGLTVGTYTLNVTDNNGCTGSSSVSITQPTTLSVSANTIANVSCNGGDNGNASANPSGGTTPYTYSWSNGSSSVATSNPTGAALSSGNYTVTVTDNNGCTATASVTITQPASALSITIASSVNSTKCINPNGSATANAASGGTSPYIYSWAPNGGTNLITSDLSPGTYTITATDNNGCTASVSVNILDNALPPAVTVCCDSTINPGENVQLSITQVSNAYTYNWAPSTALS